jgi:hypothetical protein
MNAYRILVGKPAEKRSLGRSRCRWEGNIKTDLKKIRRGSMDWFGMAQNRNLWRALVNMAMNLRVP